ncbi:RNA polymerase sigma-70 factor [Pedobacter sp.]|jgi:RNA polymerase sigma-70 factor (family 1)|uniref:RNA polymerase sigma factor n=1 Tax=Pedobacter sp. TaxID=1411316 RepID=UPI002CBDD355|nr:RNA polymerase sigma-70 factor [Pedobacter sp.]HWW40071.1 RNA polymerase sigma-70 factor [Pedobacter sp.]
MFNQGQQVLEHEQEILLQLQMGDSNAFDLIYKHYSPRIYRNILRLVKQEALAEEILQDVFMRVWEKRAALNVENSFKSYLFKIAYNLVMDFFRRAAFDRNLMAHLSVVSTAFYSNTEEITDLKDTQALLQEAIEALPPQRKKIYLMCKIEGKSYQEVSQLLDISSSTISDHIVKATKSVKEHLSDKDYAVLMAAVAIALHN